MSQLKVVQRREDFVLQLEFSGLVDEEAAFPSVDLGEVTSIVFGAWIHWIKGVPSPPRMELEHAFDGPQVSWPEAVKCLKCGGAAEADACESEYLAFLEAL
jgi:hypothetical protein